MKRKLKLFLFIFILISICICNLITNSFGTTGVDYIKNDYHRDIPNAFNNSEENEFINEFLSNKYYFKRNENSDYITFNRSFDNEVNKFNNVKSLGNKLIENSEYVIDENTEKYNINFVGSIFNYFDYGLLKFNAKQADNNNSLKIQFLNYVSGSDIRVVYTGYININRDDNQYYIPFYNYKAHLSEITTDNQENRNKYIINKIVIQYEDGTNIKDNNLEISNLEIYNFQDKISIIDELPLYNYNMLPSSGQVIADDELSENAEWRQNALEKIDEIRKGDFRVVIKDKNGKVIPDADVNFNMFEHEFNFGTAINDVTVNQYAQKIGKLFNSAVNENAFKWPSYESNKLASRNEYEKVKTYGIKNIRGHAFIWEKHFPKTDELKILNTPTIDINTVEEMESAVDKTTAHIQEQMNDYNDYGEYDVVNELIDNHNLRDRYANLTGKEANELLKKWFNTAKEANTNAKLYYNEAKLLGEQNNKIGLHSTFNSILSYMHNNNLPVYGIGLQSHQDFSRQYKYLSLVDSTDAYNKIADNYGYKLKITEYSCDCQDSFAQANYTRDFMINMFANENIEGFLMWSFTDNKSYATYSLIYDKQDDLKPAGYEYIDLVYNKWWTRNVDTTTDDNGESSIKGFYGDYDVEVEYNGNTYVKQIAFHKGYDNVVEIVLDDVELDYVINIKNPKWNSLPITQTRTLTVISNPVGLENFNNIEWSCDNTDIASIDASTGRITANAEGTTVITAVYGEKNCQFTLTVSGTLGDIDKDASVSSYDAYRALILSVSQSEDNDESVILDVDRNEKIDAWDAYRILIYSVGLINEF